MPACSYRHLLYDCLDSGWLYKIPINRHFSFELTSIIPTRPSSNPADIAAKIPPIPHRCRMATAPKD